MNSLHILDNSPLSDVSLASIFSWSVACLLILLTVSFSKQKFLILMKSRLWIISSMDYTFVVVSKKSSPYWSLPRFFPVFPSRNFIVLHFTFRSMIHYELSFVKGVRFLSWLISFFFFFLHMTVQLSQPLLKRLFFSVILPLLLCQTSVDYAYVVSFWACFWSVCLFFCQYTLSLYCSFIITIEVG